jgi:tetratricopeptide (TPR) repeat protein
VGYLGYYFAWLALSYLIRQPWLLVGLVGLWLVRGFLPPPGALFGALGRAGRLRQQVRLNRANITARRDLATIYLSLLRPRRALPLLEDALALAPDDAELLYLYGVALHRSGQHEQGLLRLLSAIEKDPRLRHGHPYFVAGEALLALERWDDAADAFERYLDFNSSAVAAHTQLARAYAGSKDAEAARKWLLGGLQTWHALPGAMKRRQLGAYLKAQWARVSVLKDPGAIVVALVLLGLCVGGVLAAYPLITGLWQPDEDRIEQMRERVRRSVALCGTQQTGEFAGSYAASPQTEQFSDFRIERDRIVSGRGLVQEFCLTKVIEQKPDMLHAEAVLRWHQVQRAADSDATPEDPANAEAARFAALFDIRLDRGADFTSFSYAPQGHPLAARRVRLPRQ